MRQITLNGQWDFVADLDPKYHFDPHIYPESPYSRPDINRRHWLKVTVPGVWQKYGERYDIFEGVCWFAREFELDSLPRNATARLRFGAVNYLCRVFLNGTEIGGHETGYTEFALDATGRLQSGTNHIAVMVDNRATTIKWPPCLGYFNYGGIHRAVTLEIMEGACLDNIAVTAEPGEKCGTLTVTGRIVQSEPALSVAVSCLGAKADADVDANGAFSGRLDVADVKPWTPDEPSLYPVSVSLRRDNAALDCVELQCGFRTIETKDGRIHLNGKPLPLKGICYVYDSPVHGLVMALEQIETDLRLIKELGCNAVRCHYPMHNNFYEACDRLGILVWIEPTVYCLHPRDDETNTPFADPEWQALAEQMVTEMIRTARNHPSVVLYGIGNECNTNNPEAEQFFRRLAEHVRREDDARLVSYAALYGNVGTLAGIVDVLGVNSYWGWYDKCFGGKGLEPEVSSQRSEIRKQQSVVQVEPIDLSKMRKMLDKVLAKNQNVALLLTEFGADSVPGFYSNSRNLWSENYHADLLREIFALADDYPQIIGTFPFGFSDYRDPSKVPNGYWNEINLKGFVTYDRKKRLAFDVVRRQYKK